MVFILALKAVLALYKDRRTFLSRFRKGHTREILLALDSRLTTVTDNEINLAAPGDAAACMSL